MSCRLEGSCKRLQAAGKNLQQRQVPMPHDSEDRAGPSNRVSSTQNKISEAVFGRPEGKQTELWRVNYASSVVCKIRDHKDEAFITSPSCLSHQPGTGEDVIETLGSSQQVKTSAVLIVDVDVEQAAELQEFLSEMKPFPVLAQGDALAYSGLFLNLTFVNRNIALTRPAHPNGFQSYTVQIRGMSRDDPTGSRCDLLVRLLDSQQGESGSNLGGVAPELSLVRIVPDDAAGRRVFVAISRFAHPFSTQVTPPTHCACVVPNSTAPWPYTRPNETHLSQLCYWS
ncbi:hypothetical protein PR048_020292 [Dryococelus australis]|uniref:Uncharacterized protein n=1 Tax=Dryococelus australis TaxID=614101 RepID=A0ABQ9H5X9_9NEOP|nr:hypothetical protein PR048_020292 [Dryococelus australis]